MKVAMFISSKYGLQCYKAVEKMEGIEMVGILTTPLHFTLRYERNKTKEMQNAIYEDVVKESLEKKTQIYITDKVNSEDSINMIQKWKPDLIIVSGWYHIISGKVLAIPEKGVIGLHASLLPRYRGGAPLAWQIIRGEKESGITLFYIGQGVDTGDIIGQKKVLIAKEDDIGTLYEKVGEAGIELLTEYVPQIANNCAPRNKQIDIDKYSVYPQRKESDGRIDWLLEPVDIYNFVRAQTRPYPGAFSTYKGVKVFIWKCKAAKTEGSHDIAGTIIDIWEKHPVISVGRQGGAVILMDYSLETDDESIEMKKGERLM